MKESLLGGVPDNWTGHPSADRTTKDELKAVPPVVGIHRPLQALPRSVQGMTTAKRPPRKPQEEPPDAA